MTGEDENKALAQNYADELRKFWQTGDLSFIDRIFAKNYVQHVPGIPASMTVGQIFTPQNGCHMFSDQ